MCNNSALLLKYSVFLNYIDLNVAQSDRQLNPVSIYNTEPLYPAKSLYLNQDYNCNDFKAVAKFSCCRELQAASHLRCIQLHQISYYLNENCPFSVEAQTAAGLQLRKDLFVDCS